MQQFSDTVISSKEIGNGITPGMCVLNSEEYLSLNDIWTRPTYNSGRGSPYTMG